MERRPVKLATFNINHVNKRLPNLLAWLKSAKPDVVCLQELKAEQDAFPLAAIEKAGYYAAWSATNPRTALRSSQRVRPLRSYG